MGWRWRRSKCVRVCNFQKCYYFPPKSKLRQLLRLPAYRKLLQHEFDRPRKPPLVSDVYDTSAWSELMGPPSSPTRRIALLYCSDGIPAFNKHRESISLIPCEWCNLSLPPTIRVQSRYMLLQMIIPDTVKNEAQRKYYNFAANFELNEIFENGIDGVKVYFFGMSMDTKGKEQILGMQTSQVCVL